MQEYLVRHREKWWHFFIKPFYGLCYRKKEGVHFLHFEVLLSDICEDFCALSSGGQIHVVCQDKAGSILYLTYDGETWRKSVLLESKAANPYPKHFCLIPMAGHLNLFYIIAHKERYMLIHQLLAAEDKPPAVVDHINPAAPPFIAAAHTGTEITLLYENENGVSGTRLYRWSRKEFSRFVPVHPAAGCLVRGLWVEPDDRTYYAGLQSLSGVTNLVFFERSPEGDFTEPVTVYLDCPADAVPVFCKNEEKLYLVWRENGSIMSSHSADGGGKWSKPLRYMKGAALEPVLFTLSENGSNRCAYGHSAGRDLVLYAVPELSNAPAPAPRPRPAGYGAEEFARRMGALQEEVPVPPASDAALAFLKTELAALKEQLFSLRLELAAVKEQCESLAQKQSLDEGELTAKPEEQVTF